MIKGIVFDKDGTLIEYARLWAPVVKKALQMLLTDRGIDIDTK